MGLSDTYFSTRIKRRFGNVKSRDFVWLASRFLRAFESSYQGRSDITVELPIPEDIVMPENPGVELRSRFDPFNPKNPMENISIEDVLNEWVMPLAILDGRLPGDFESRLYSAVGIITPGLTPTIKATIKPKTPEEPMGFGLVKYEPQNPNTIYFYGLGSRQLLSNLSSDFHPRNIAEQVLYRYIRDRS